MSKAVENFEQKAKRCAIALNFGGRPLDPPPLSGYGSVTVCKKGEKWPESNNKFMLPLAQIDLTQLPFSPPGFEGIAFITLFICEDVQTLSEEDINGSCWALRTYKSLDELIPLEIPETIDASRFEPRQMHFAEIENEYPNWEDAFTVYGKMPIEEEDFKNAPEIPEEVSENYHSNYGNSPNSKLAGWPTLIHSEIFWAPWNKHPANPKYMFQLQHEEVADWGGYGFLYFGKGTTLDTENEWFVSSQYD